MTHQSEAADAREQDRAEGLKGAVVVPGKGKAEFRCLIANISDEGAELRLDAHQRVPTHFTLNVPHHGRLYRAETRWREDGRVGVRFTGWEAGVPALKVVGA